MAEPRAPDVGAVPRRGTVQDGCVGRGTGRYETLVAIPIDDFIASL